MLEPPCIRLAKNRANTSPIRSRNCEPQLFHRERKIPDCQRCLRRIKADWVAAGFVIGPRKKTGEERPKINKELGSKILWDLIVESQTFFPSILQYHSSSDSFIGKLVNQYDGTSSSVPGVRVIHQWNGGTDVYATNIIETQ